MIENIPELVHFKIDTVNGRIRNSYMYVWEEADIVDGTASYKVNHNEDGITGSATLSVKYSPPGNMSIDLISFDDDSSMTMNSKGVCQASDASVFEKAFKETED